MATFDTVPESPRALAEALHTAARKLRDGDPLRALGMAEIAEALARTCGDLAASTAAGATAASCRSRLLETRGDPVRV